MTSIRIIPGRPSADEAGLRSDHKLHSSLYRSREGRDPGPSESHCPYDPHMWADPSPLISTKSGAALLPSCRTKSLEVDFPDVGVDLLDFPCSSAVFVGLKSTCGEEK